MTSPKPVDAILLVAHGTVESLADLPEFLNRIRHGRPAPPGLVEELRRRYEAIGGSPLLAVTRAQALALEAQSGLPVLVGMRLWDPSVEAALRSAAERGFRRIALVPLAPFSVVVYADAARAALESLRSELGERTPELAACGAWGSAPGFVAAHAELIAAALAESAPSTPTRVVLTAHSLPMRAIRAGDHYQTEVEASARAIAERLNLYCELAYQSQGADGGEWLGPDLRQTLERQKQAGIREIVLAPFGFLSDHVETLYDLDIEAQGWAKELGLVLRRLPALNTDPRLIAVLAEAAASTSD